MVVNQPEGCYVSSKRGLDGIGLSKKIGILDQTSPLEGRNRRRDG